MGTNSNKKKVCNLEQKKGRADYGYAINRRCTKYHIENPSMEF